MERHVLLPEYRAKSLGLYSYWRLGSDRQPLAIYLLATTRTWTHTTYCILFFPRFKQRFLVKHIQKGRRIGSSCHFQAPHPMQYPTCTRLRIRSVQDAEVVLHAVYLKRLPMVARRLDDEERLYLTTGCIYVWEERSSNPLEATGQEIQRFTEGRSWGPSRARDDFLLYYEKESASRSSLMIRNNLAGSSQMIKQTYSVYVHDGETPPRKWHLNAYYTQDSVDRLRVIEQVPELKGIQVPEGRYVCARTGGTRRNRHSVHSPSLSANGPAKSQTPPSPHAMSGRSTSSASRDNNHAAKTSLPTFTSSAPRISVLAKSPMNPVAQSPGASLTLSGDPHRRLAPLDYLRSIPPVARDPIDDEALRSFGSI